MIPLQMTPEVIRLLKAYVYIYIDPRNNSIFYVGKGKGNRLFSHLKDQSETDKVIRIKEIKQSGCEPHIELIRYGLSDNEAALVEAATIDLIGKANLTNRIAGHHKGSFGRIASQEVIMMLSAQHVDVKERAILITINQLYRSNMSEKELYEATRGIWVIGKRREKAEYAMAVYQGIVREVYKINRWHPSGTLIYETRDSAKFKSRKRWEFEGAIANDVRNQYIGFSVGKSGQNPIRYVNI